MTTQNRKITVPSTRYCDTINERANSLYNEVRDEEALREYDKAISEFPNYAGFHYEKGRMLSKLWRHEEALDELDKAIHLDPESAYLHEGKAQILDSLKR